MAFLQKIKIDKYRNLEAVDLSLDSNIFIYGNNGSGKSNFIDAIYQLAYGKSLFFNQNKYLIKNGCEEFSLFAELDSAYSPIISIGMTKNRLGKKTAKVNHKPISRQSSISLLFPVIAVTPKTIDSITGTSVQRRSFINLAMFHVEHKFFKLWKDYNKLLKQRNHLIKQKQVATLTTWDNQLSDYANQIHLLVKSFTYNLEESLKKYTQNLLGFSNIEIKYNKGWAEENLAKTLKLELEKDLLHGYTNSGIHRFNITYTQNNVDVVKIFSQAQVKLLSLSLYLSLVDLIEDKKVLLLLDDPLAELDDKNCAKMIEILQGLKCQIIMTSSVLIDGIENTFSMFHVEHGTITPKQEKI